MAAALWGPWTHQPPCLSTQGAGREGARQAERSSDKRGSSSQRGAQDAKVA